MTFDPFHEYTFAFDEHGNCLGVVTTEMPDAPVSFSTMSANGMGIGTAGSLDDAIRAASAADVACIRMR